MLAVVAILKSFERKKFLWSVLVLRHGGGEYLARDQAYNLVTYL